MKQNDLSTADLERLSALVASLEQAKKDKAEKNAIAEKIMEFFRSTGLKSFKYKDIVIRFTDERETTEFDVDMLREKYPEIWKECHSLNVRPPHLSIKKRTVKEDDDDLPTDEELAEAANELAES